MVIPPDDGIDSHGKVIHYNSQVIHGSSITSLDNKIIHFSVLKCSIAFYNVFDNGSACVRGFKADNCVFTFFKIFLLANAVVHGF